MKKTLLAATSAMVLAISTVSSASAKDGFYLAVRGGNTNFNLNNKKDASTDSAREDYGDTWHVAGALGYKYKYFRLEGEYTFRNNIDDNYENIVSGNITSDRNVKLDADTFLVNAYVDLMPNYWISPYIAGGIGLSRLKLESHVINGAGSPETSEKDTTFTWMLGAGLSLRLNRCLNLDAGYRYVDMGELGHAEFTLHEVYGGLRFTF